MSDTTNNEDGAMSEQDEEDLAKLQEQPINHTLLEIWRNILGNIETIHNEKIPPAIALKIISSWPQLSFAEVQDYHEKYYEILGQYRDALDEVIKAHPGALKNTAEYGNEFSDAIANREAYLDLLFEWQFLALKLEAAWHTTDADAGVVIAAIADAAAFCTGPQGLVQHLSNEQIGFAFTDDDQVVMGARLELARAEL